MDTYQENENMQPAETAAETPVQTAPVEQLPDHPPVVAPVQPQPHPVQPAYPYPQNPYRTPVYSQPVYAQPVYSQPVYAQPAYPQPANTKPKTKGKIWKRLVAAVLVVLLVASGCVVTGVCVTQYWEKENAARNTTLLKSVNERLDAMKQEMSQNSGSSNGNSVSGTPNTNVTDGLTVAQVYNQNVNCVAIITCEVSSGWMRGTSLGSGFVLTSDGYVVTNYHVVEGGSSIKVQLVNGTTYDATYVGGDQAHDIALLKVDAQDLQAAKMGSSNQLIVGDQVVAIGYPLSTQVPVLTVGYISAKEQIVDTGDVAIRMMQTDAAINSGNSGGPLFNMKGEVIGITSAKDHGTSSTGVSIEGVGYAIPIDDVMGKLTDLKEKGYISGAYMGINGQTITQQISSQYGVPGGVYITNVTSGSCAQKAGLQREDIIVNLAGYDIATMSDLSMVLNRLSAGDEVTITVYRMSEDGEVVLNITLDEKPEQ